MAQSSSVSRMLVPLGVAAAVVLLCAAMLANSMTKPVSRDEHMYCTAGALLAQGKMIYSDFSYPSQLPYHPLLLAALYRGLGTSHYLLVGRLVSVVSDVLVVLCIMGIYRSVFGARRVPGLLFGLAAVVLYLFNPVVDNALGHAWNHDVVILCVVASLWLFITTDFGRRSRFWRIGLMGILLTAASFMRVMTVLVELLFLVAVFLAVGGSWKNRSVTALPFSLASLVTAICPLWIIAQAPEAFRLNLIHIPALYGRWLHAHGFTFDKLGLTAATLRRPAYLVLLILAACLVWVILRCSSRLTSHDKWKVVVALALPPLFFVIACIPPTMWKQYLAVPVPFLVIAFAYPLAALTNRKSNIKHPIPAICLLGIGVVITVLANPAVLYRSIAVFVPEKWTPVELHRTAVDIAAKTKEPRLALTLGPLYAIEGGCDIYPELSCGDIVYRIGDELSPAQRQLVHAVGPASLPALTALRPPAVVIAGVERSPYPELDEIWRQLEDPLLRSIIVSRPETYRPNLQVYFRQ